MTSFTTRAVGTSITRPDSTKHVNYSLGMVLGVDDFTQEFAYLTGRNQWLARDLVGYGTAVGLQVSVDYRKEAQGIVEVVVAPGAALSPRGQLIRVTPKQCADINHWLAQERNRARRDALLGNATSGTLALFVVLSYRDCATDNVPIPGEPCRSEEESVAASRLADNFRLELMFDAPDQREENALRQFVGWLEQVNITSERGQGFVSLKDFEAAVRNSMQATPPHAASIRVNIDSACEFLRAAFRIWATELRPAWLGRDQTPDGALPAEEGVLLAELNVPVVKGTDGQWTVTDSTVRTVEVREERRPYLLHLRMVQEWIECNQRTRAPGDSVVAEQTFGQQPSSGTLEAYSRADHTHGTPPLEGDVGVNRSGGTVLERIRSVPLEFDEDTATDGQVLTYVVEDEGQVKDEIDDETERKIREEKGEEVRVAGPGAVWRPKDLLLQGARVARESEVGPPNSHDVLTYIPGAGGEEGFWRAAPTSRMQEDLSLKGDVTGTTSATSVERLRDIPLADLSKEEYRPRRNQVLTYVVTEREGEGQWQAADPQSEAPADLTLEGDVTGSTTTGTTVRRISGTQVADLTSAPLVPQPGQVLTYLPSGSAPTDPRRWQAATPTVDGDVTGTSASNTLSRIQGVPLALKERELADGDVLTFRGSREEGSWVSQPPPSSNLSGDVNGATTRNQVQGIYGFPIAGRTSDVMAIPAFNDGDVLIFADGRWVPTPQGGPPREDIPEEPEPGDTTIDKPSAPASNVVAAGMVRDGESSGPTYNNLNLRVVGNGQVTVGFDGYAMPDDTFQYIVKALPVFNAELRLTNLVVMFDSFLKTEGLGFRLRVMNDGQPMDGEMLRFLYLMIEVSRYDAIAKE
jgi:hypothetical protein